MPSMDVRELFRQSLRALLAALQAPDPGPGAADAARAVLAVAGGPGQARVRALLKLDKAETRRLLDEVGLFLQHDTVAGGARNAELAMLRVLSWFETSRSNQSSVAAPSAGVAEAGRVQAYLLVSTLELMMRDLLRHLHPSEGDIRARLEQALPAEARDALRRSPNDPVAGLFLKDLVRLYLDAQEWVRLEPLYRPSPLLRLLSEQRATAERFLEDVRRIRNDVAHVKQLSAVQHALLVYYHEELVAPVRDAYQAGATPVDPSRYASPAGQVPDTELKDMEQRIALEVRQEGRRAQRIAIAGLLVSALLVLVSAPVWWPALRLAADPDRAFLDTLEDDPRQLGSLAVQACELNRPDALRHLAAQPGAAQALAGDDAPALQARMLMLMLRQPAQAAACMPTMARMSWNADAVSGSTVARLFGDRLSPGFERFAADHPQGLVPGRNVPPGVLRCPPLVLAVWLQDAALVQALRRAGAKAETACVIDAVWTDGRQDRASTSALAEAQRSGDSALVVALDGR